MAAISSIRHSNSSRISIFPDSLEPFVYKAFEDIVSPFSVKRSSAAIDVTNSRIRELVVKVGGQDSARSLAESN